MDRDLYKILRISLFEVESEKIWKERIKFLSRSETVCIM